MAGSKDVLLGLYDANFGMYERDEEIATHMRHLQDTRGWPNAFEVTTGKSRYDRILDIADMLRNKMVVTCSVQSWNDDTLRLIKRKNLPRDQYREIVAEVKRRGMRATAECIMPLPAETKESFFEGIRFLIDSGIEFINAYTTMMLKGTELSSPESRRGHRLETRYRILPRQLGQYRGEKCFEIEEACIATAAMSFDNYLECRGFAFIATLFSSEQYDVCRRLLKENGGDVYEWFLDLWRRTRNGGTELTALYEEFLQETRDELFDSEQAIRDHFSDEGNYARLLSGEVGDNLMRKYTTRVMIEQSGSAIAMAFGTLAGTVPELQAESVRAWMVAGRDIGAAFHDPGSLGTDLVAELGHDVEGWYHCGDGRLLASFEAPGCYRFFCDNERVEESLSQQVALYDSLFFAAMKFFIYFSPKDLWRRCEAVDG
jgi:hypothetical protein